MRIGRDHIASSVYTLVLAYAGSAIPVLLLVSLSGRSVHDIATDEVAEEALRGLVGGIGLVASVPLTTALAVAVVAGRRGGAIRKTETDTVSISTSPGRRVEALIEGGTVAVDVCVAGEEDVVDAGRVMSRVLEEDLGGFQQRWHGDVEDPLRAYVRADRSALFVARVDGAVVGTAAVQPCALQSPPNPAWLAERYSRPAVCELRRVWVPAEARRQGVAAALIRAAAGWATTAGGFRTVYLHTDTSAPGAEAFWRAMPTVEVHDCRPDPFHCVHFVLDVEKLLGDGRR